MRKMISWTITIVAALVITGFVVSHGLQGTLHAWLSWSSDVYRWLSSHTPKVKGPVPPMPNHPVKISGL